MQENCLAGEVAIPEDRIVGSTTKSRRLVGHFEAGDDRNGIDWADLLREEEDRDLVTKYLEERQKVGFLAVKKMHKDSNGNHRADTKTLREEHASELRALQRTSDETIASLRTAGERDKTEMETQRETLEKLSRHRAHLARDLDELKRDHFRSETDRREQRKELRSLGQTLASAEGRTRDLDAAAGRDQNRATRLRATIDQNDRDLASKNAEASGLREKLEASLASRGEMVERERDRLASNRAASTQFGPVLADASVQAEFLPVAGLRALASKHLWRDRSFGIPRHENYDYGNHNRRHPIQFPRCDKQTPNY